MWKYKLKSTIFWDMTPCSLLKEDVSEERKHATYFNAVFLLGLFFDSEDEGDMFL
jgi:hypothetical protein